MRYAVTHGETVIGETELAPLPATPDEERTTPEVPGLLVGPLEPTAAYETIRPLCRRLIEALESDDGGDAADGKNGAPDKQAMDDVMRAMHEMRALDLGLRTLDGTPVPTHHVVIQDFSGLADEVAGVAGVPLISVSAVLATTPWPIVKGE